jgi:hypothetical protein
VTPIAAAHRKGEKSKASGDGAGERGFQSGSWHGIAKAPRNIRQYDDHQDADSGANYPFY